MVPLAHLLAGCYDEHTRQGQNSNSEVLQLLWDMAAHRTVQTYELAPKLLAIRKDLSIRVAPPFYFVEGTTAYVFWLQPRKNYALDLAALNLLSSIVKATFLVDDFRDVGFEVCDMSAPALGRDRNPTIYHLESFNIMAESETRAKLQLFALAYDRLVARGVERSKRTAKQQPLARPDLLGE
jgi:hypothetical protein